MPYLIWMVFCWVCCFCIKNLILIKSMAANDHILKLEYGLVIGRSIENIAACRLPVYTCISTNPVEIFLPMNILNDMEIKEASFAFYVFSTVLFLFSLFSLIMFSISPSFLKIENNSKTSVHFFPFLIIAHAVTLT